MLASYHKLLALVLLVGQAWAIPSSYSSDFKVKEALHQPPAGWTRLHAAPPDHLISLRIALPQSRFDDLEQHLFAVSDPESEMYGQHLSKEAVEELVKPPQDSLEKVNAWLEKFGFGEEELDRSPAKDWVNVKVTVKVAEEMLGTKYHVWKHDESGDLLVRTTRYSLPASLHSHIEVIQPTTMFSRFNQLSTSFRMPDAPRLSAAASLPPPLTTPSEARLAGDIDPSCNEWVTVECLAKLYKTEGYVPQVPEKNKIGITGYLEQYNNDEDLRLFYEDQVPQAVNSTYEWISVAGGLNEQDPEVAGVEANLDCQFGFGLTYPTTPVYWSTGGRPPFKPDLTTPINTNEPYAEWVDFVLKQKDVPFSISTSYGEPEQTVPEAYARRVCRSFAQLGARGVSLLFASGDGGVGDNRDNPDDHRCWTNDGRNITRFLPTFPTTCPYVTSVGGTTNIPEISVFFSGGGFSDYWPRPRYQDKHVKGYLKSIPKDLYKGLWNRNGRGFPDVAALGTNYRVFWQGEPWPIGGTSASSPTFAAVVALLNDARLAKGKRPLGFLNPILYAKGYQGLNDIKGGHPNPGCGTSGFNSTEGWDPVTGLGTPDFVKLKALLA